ncbi:MAG: 23S rRNA (uracil(1939)-C(5))-methyltransferase RlmD [Myxococcales bacterium]|nr:23S rRNA (uracil(1939)-C(5))-methyltransferase RlmD [Myxococcales bacterium]
MRYIDAMIKGDAVTVAIETLDEEGAGVGRVGEQRLHVAMTLPGERVVAEVEHLSPHRADVWARRLRLEVAAPDRVEPACPAYGRCGGCVLQHLVYARQLEHKRARLTEALAACRLLSIGREVAPCVASPRSEGYRNKSKLVAARSDGGVILGAYAPRSHEVIDLAGCAVAEPPLDEVAGRLAALATACGVLPYDEGTREGDLRHAVLRVNFRGEVLAVLVVARRGGHGIAELARSLSAADPRVVGVIENLQPAPGNVLFGEAERDLILVGVQAIEEDIGSVRLRLSPRAFCQVNRGIAARLYADVAAAAALTGTERVIDVYTGIGGIALTLAPRAAQVIGIEEHEGAVADARAGADLNDAAHATFLAGDAARLLGDPSIVGQGAEVIVLNPPRKGADRAVLEACARLAPRTILYVSCAPATLARDLAVLATLGYGALRSATPYDMLPHTPHVEALAVIERSDAA